MSKKITMAEVLANPNYLLTIEDLNLTTLVRNSIQNVFSQVRGDRPVFVADVVGIRSEPGLHSHWITFSEEDMKCFEDRGCHSPTGKYLKRFGLQSARQLKSKIALLGVELGTKIIDRPESDAEFCTLLIDAASKLSSHIPASISLVADSQPFLALQSFTSLSSGKKALNTELLKIFQELGLKVTEHGEMPERAIQEVADRLALANKVIALTAKPTAG